LLLSHLPIVKGGWDMKAQNNVKVIRENSNLTVRELERLSGVSHSTITRIENGFAIPNQKQIFHISYALKKDPCELFRLNRSFVKL
jgi:transcriptional regulator with XRE-family HTH domain